VEKKLEIKFKGEHAKFSLIYDSSSDFINQLRIAGSNNDLFQMTMSDGKEVLLNPSEILFAVTVEDEDHA